MHAQQQAVAQGHAQWNCPASNIRRLRKLAGSRHAPKLAQYNLMMALGELDSRSSVSSSAGQYTADLTSPLKQYQTPVCSNAVPRRNICSLEVHCKAAAHLSSSSRHRLGLKVYSLVISTRRVSRLSPGSLYGWRLAAALLRASNRCCSSGTPRSLQRYVMLKQHKCFGGLAAALLGPDTCPKQIPLQLVKHINHFTQPIGRPWENGMDSLDDTSESFTTACPYTWTLPCDVLYRNCLTVMQTRVEVHLPGVLCAVCMAII